MRNLVVIPFHDYKTSLKEGFRTRDSHLYQKFIEDKSIDNVVIVNRPTSLIEVLTLRKKIRTNNNIVFKNKFCYIQKIAENRYVIDVLVFDTWRVVKNRHAWLPYIYERRDIVTNLKAALHYLNIKDFAVYSSSPFSVVLGIKIGANRKMLDAVDNFAKYKEWAYFQNKIISLYERAKSSYDIIYVNSTDTLNFLQENCSAKLKLVPNGVDSNDFQGNYKCPADLPDGKPIVGYAGKIQRMFNAELLANLAEMSPEVNFVLLGKFLDKKWKRKYWDNKLKNISNIFYLGDKNYSVLPSYYSNFDICMIPYFIENQHGGDPIKFYEYLACKKPIISTDIGNINEFHNGKNIIICKDEITFIKGMKALIKNLDSMDFEHTVPANREWGNIATNLVNELFIHKPFASSKIKV